MSIRYTQRLTDRGLEPSVGSVGDSYDNPLAETIIGLFKTEVINRLGPWKSKDQVEWETLQWVDWFNRERLLEPLYDLLPPAKPKEYIAPEMRLDGFSSGPPTHPKTGTPSLQIRSRL